MASKRRLRRAGYTSGGNMKAVAERRHAKNRLATRIGLELNEQEYLGLLNSVRSGECEIYDKQSNRVIRYVIEYRGQKFGAVYDKERKEITTFLTLEMLKGSVYET